MNLPTVISGLALAVSVITLWLAHLRGPSIGLALQGKTLPCHELRHRDKDLWTVVVRILLVNTGNRAGILFTFRLDPVDEGIDSYRLDTPPELALPQSLMPGSSWKVGADIQVKTDAASLARYAARSDQLRLKAVFTATGSLASKPTRTVNIWIDLSSLQAKLRDTAQSRRR